MRCWCVNWFIHRAKGNTLSRYWMNINVYVRIHQQETMQCVLSWSLFQEWRIAKQKREIIVSTPDARWRWKIAYTPHMHIWDYSIPCTPRSARVGLCPAYRYKQGTKPASLNTEPGCQWIFLRIFALLASIMYAHVALQHTHTHIQDPRHPHLVVWITTDPRCTFLKGVTAPAAQEWTNRTLVDHERSDV